MTVFLTILLTTPSVHTVSFSLCKQQTAHSRLKVKAGQATENTTARLYSLDF